MPDGREPVGPRFRHALTAWTRRSSDGLLGFEPMLCSVQDTRTGDRDPMMALVLSLCFPGLGHLYAGRPGQLVVVLAIEAALLYAVFAASAWFVVVLGLFHLFQAIASAGAVRQANERTGAAGPVLPPVPPPPPPRAHRARDVAATRPTRTTPPAEARPQPVAPGPALDADSFLGELRDGWRAAAEGAISPEEFHERKRQAIERVRVPNLDEGTALLEAAQELVAAGVLTSMERARLQTRITRS